jgi:hypothetical protein
MARINAVGTGFEQDDVDTIVGPACLLGPYLEPAGQQLPLEDYETREPPC